MERLSGRDLRTLSVFVRDLYQLRPHDEFTTHLIDSLPSITEGEFTSYNEFVVGSPTVIYKSDQLPHCPNPLHYAKILEDNLHEHPVVAHFLRTNDKSAHTFSDFISARKFQATTLHNEFYKPLKMSFLLFMGLRAGKRMLSISRHRNDREFPHRAKTTFNAIHPHIQQALANSLAVTRMHNELEAFHKASDNGQQGVIYVTGRGRMRFASLHARQLLKEYGLETGPASDFLPTHLRDWLSHLRKMVEWRDDVPSVTAPLVIKGESGQLTIRRIGQGLNDVLLFEEQQTIPSLNQLRHFGLSKRELEVLGWVARGKTNPEIGQILNISRRTVQKHLEHVYLKLGVENRMAAVAFIGNTTSS
ncbi:helix-turn-helix transcriptional regulator [Nitrosomonas sp.]|uniref:helix-turn-helix transcriptional regulator n=1 Tax=Nitrosomonas sp. TaxID=42353 RepID=UPI002601183D|nr:helix-turn-helix transcriptional regulator [Nitrosomonas sp.]